ncbi:MAG: hypothetical protein H0W82_03270 [Actinobacteria bacterium]|nr:hypothetical protein [Actinomycetota bacterium]
MESTPKDLLTEANRARSEARSMRRGAWFPLIVFGALMVASAPLYRLSGRVTRPDGISVLTYGSRWISVYWLIAVPLGYAVCVLSYRRRATRTGVAGSLWPYVATGLGLFALMSLVPPGIVAEWTPGFAHSWTALPLISLAAGLLVLSRLERDWMLMALSLGLLALAVLSETIYDVALGWQGLSAAGFSGIVSGVLLLLAGAIQWMTRNRAA